MCPDVDEKRRADAFKILWVDAARRQELLEQYRIYVESCFHASNWRVAANTLHLSLAALLLGGFAFLMQRDPIPKPLVLVAWGAGLALAIQWWMVIRQYKNLNTAKFAIIHEVERHLAIAPFAAEWSLVDHGKLPRLYRPVSHIEQYMPVVMLTAETIVAAYVLWFA